MTLFRVTGIILIVLPIAFNLIFFALGRAFEYPDILRKPTDYIFTQFTAGGRRLVGLWYAFMFTALLFVPAALLLGAVFSREAAELAWASALIGVLAGLIQVLGLMRWVFLVPLLARQYGDTAASPATRDAIAVVFGAFHQYAGVAIGEHLGYLFTSAWTVLISLMMAQSPIFSPILGIIGVVAAVGITIGVFEQTGWKAAGAINAISYILWSLWLLVAGVILLLSN